MDPTQTISLFLARVAKRLRWRDGISAGIYLVAGLIGLALISPFWALWAGFDRSQSWFFVALALLALVSGGVAAILLPKRRWAKHSDSARYVGEQVKAVRSDLLSALELMGDTGHGAGSQDLRQALFAQTARRVGPLSVPTLVPYSGLRNALRTVLAAIILYGGVALALPDALATGWNHLLRPAQSVPFDGASLADKPLVEDVHVVVEFPIYTKMTNLNLPSSSGDFEVMPGAIVTLSTKVPKSVKKVRILLSSTDELVSDEEIDFAPKDGGFSATFEVREETYYRFELTFGDERKVEARARHIEIGNDKAPRVEFFAPADELDIAKIKRVELAYTASDDFGVAMIELVYGEKSGQQTRKALHAPPPDEVTDSFQSKMLWDLAELDLRPGIEIEYYLEVTDNDNVLGPNRTKSRVYTLRIFSPRERHEELIERQQEVAAHMLELLAARLTVNRTSISLHRDITRFAAEIVVELGSLVAAFKSDELSQAALATTFEKLRDRMNARATGEEQQLIELEAIDGEELRAKRLSDSDTKNTAELEDDILTIGDWLHRQEMENLLGISDEVKASQERLDKLFEEYKRTGSPELLKEIERELRALEKKLEKMASQSGGMPEDVLDRFVNSDALQQEQEADCLATVKELLALGDTEAAQKQMKTCSQNLDDSAKALEESLRSLRSDKFSEEEKEFQEAMNQLADLAQDQRDIADKADGIYERYAVAVSELMQEKSAEVQKSSRTTLEKLNKKLQEIPKSGLSSFSKEELEILEQRLKDTEAMLKRNEFAEALSMARYAKRSLKMIREELKFTLDEDWSRDAVVAEKHAREALPLARKLIDELKEATPPPSSIMSKADRVLLEKLKRLQLSTRSRTQRLWKKLNEKGSLLPGTSGQTIQEGLTDAMKHMQRAEKQMRKRDPGGARQEAREAATMLNDSKKSAQGAARKQQEQNRASWRDEPIRIPGAEDYKAPQEFREEILKAMKRDKGPAGFSEQVKRYYKEIIQ